MWYSQQENILSFYSIHPAIFFSNDFNDKNCNQLYETHSCTGAHQFYMQQIWYSKTGDQNQLRINLTWTPNKVQYPYFIKVFHSRFPKCRWWNPFFWSDRDIFSADPVWLFLANWKKCSVRGGSRGFAESNKNVCMNTWCIRNSFCYVS